QLHVCLVLALASDVFAGLLPSDLSHGHTYEAAGLAGHGAALIGTTHTDYAVRSSDFENAVATPIVTKATSYHAVPSIATAQAVPVGTGDSTGPTVVSTTYHTAPVISSVHDSPVLETHATARGVVTIHSAPALKEATTTHRAAPDVPTLEATPDVSTYSAAPTVTRLYQT
ncbi:secreted salivary gland peptide, putative, partial [Ixodes scapularis]